VKSKFTVISLGPSLLQAATSTI